MEFPIRQKGTSMGEPGNQDQEHRATTPVANLNRDKGQDGFWARIVFQDEGYPFRYAFIEQHRFQNPAAYGHDSNVASDADWINSNQSLDATGNVVSPLPTDAQHNFESYVGEQSIWNIGNEAIGIPFNKINADDAGDNLDGKADGTVRIPPGKVFLWATEVNKNQSVPNGSIVWMTTGPTYQSGELNPNNQQVTNVTQIDYKFMYSLPVYAMIMGQQTIGSTSGGGTGPNAAPNGNYSWEEVHRERKLDIPDRLVWNYSNPNGEWRDSRPAYGGYFDIGLPSPLQPAREINGQTKVPFGTIVLLYPSQVIQYNSDGTVYSTEWLFESPFEDVHFAKAQADWVLDTPLCYVSCRNCRDILGNGVSSTETPFNIYFLPTTNGQQPAVFTGDVITYRGDSSIASSPFCTSPGTFDEQLASVKMFSKLTGQTLGKGWHLMDGTNPAGNKLGGALPDMRGLFPRCLDPAGTLWNNPGPAPIPEGVDSDFRGVSTTRNKYLIALNAAGTEVVEELEDAESYSGPANGGGTANDAAVKTPSYVIGVYIRYK